MPDTKHLELLESAVTRMAGNSFIAKGWSVTLATVMLGLAAKDGGPEFALIGLMPVLLFWFLDAYYLALERGFRELFKNAADVFGKGGAPTFEMSPLVSPAGVVWAMVRPGVALVHFPLLLILCLAFILLSVRDFSVPLL